MIGDRTRTIVIAVVTAVWASNFIASVVVTDYEPTESINGIFMAIVGGLFALGARNNGSNGGGSEKKDGEPGDQPESRTGLKKRKSPPKNKDGPEGAA